MVDSVGGIDVGIAAGDEQRRRRLPPGREPPRRRAGARLRPPALRPADGDLDRAQRQQNALRALLTKVADTGHARRPGRPVPTSRRRQPVRQRRRHPEQRRPALASTMKMRSLQPDERLVPPGAGRRARPGGRAVGRVPRRRAGRRAVERAAARTASRATPRSTPTTPSDR